jgi:hypothetical protein
MAEVIPFPQNQESNVGKLRYEIEEKLFAASDILDRFPTYRTNRCFATC